MTARIDIDAPIEAVFETAMAPSRTLEWVTIVRGVGAVDGGPLREGFRMDQTLCLRGVRFKVHWTLTELDAPRYARWEGRGPARSKAVIEDKLSERDGGTRFDYRNEFHTPFGPLGAVASRALIGGIPKQEAVASLRRLKTLVEQEHSGEAAERRGAAAAS